MKIQTLKLETRRPAAYDVLIGGGGAAGMSAAMWCSELGLSALLLERTGELGGQLLWTYNPIANHLGIKTESGREMRDIFVEQIADRRFDLLTEAEISGIDLKNKKVFLAGGECFAAKFLIIATGVRRRTLGIEGEEKFKNRGILHSGKRDGGSVKNKRAVVVGGGDAAIENALILASDAEKVFVVHRRAAFRARPEFLEKAENDPRIEFLTGTIIENITGTEKIEAVGLKNTATGRRSVLPVDAVLLRIGVEPNTGAFRGKLELDESGYIVVDSSGETSAKGIFAVGDAANPVSPTISTAAGTAATAVKRIFSLLHS